MQIEENVSLAQYTTFHIGGPARFFVKVSSAEELKEAFEFAKEKSIKALVLGGGSNVLMPDEGFDGLIVKIELKGIEIEKEEKKEDVPGRQDGIVLIAGAGESWDAVVARSVEEKLWGLENLSGIPGTVGGAVAGNIGAYGAALSQTFVWAKVFDTEAGEIKKMSSAECAFGYRDSFFKHDDGRHSIVRAAFALSPAGTPDISYKDLAARFNDSSQDIAAIREAVLGIRAGKFPDLNIEGTAGSFFKNPILPLEAAEKLKERYPEMPLFYMPETSDVKVPIAWLMDHVLGLHGARVGGARLFEKQALVIAAERECTAQDVRELSHIVSKKVFDAFGIVLEAEVKILL